MDNYSLSDLAAVTGGNTGFGGSGGGLWLLIILFFLIGFGGNGFGGNRSDYGTFATAASQNEILSGQKFDATNRAINQIGDGISSLGYSQLQQMSANTAAINSNITAEGRALQSQLAECCCSNQLGIANMKADLSTAIHAEGEATRALLQQNKIEALQSQINSLQLAQATSGVPRISPYMYNVVPSCCCNNGSF